VDLDAAVKVLVVDDQSPFRLAARMVIKRTPGFEVVGEATSGEDSVTMAMDLHPDLVLMDINMGAMSGIEATREIVAGAPDTLVFLCSTYNREDLPPGALDTGAAAYLNKEELAPAVLSDLWAQWEPSR
jgi:two-component system invasion response regulator UvrY